MKRKFRGNQFSLESSSSAKPPAKELDYSQDEASSLQPCSASQKKLSSPIPGWIVDKERDASSPYSNPDSSCEDDISSLSCSEDDSDAYSDDETTSSDSTDLNGTRLVDISCLHRLLSSISVCRQCLEGELAIEDERREGLASSVFLRCQMCGASSGWCDLLPRAGRFYQVNRRSVLAMRVIGRGHTALKKFCGIMDLPPPVAWPAFNGHQKAIAQAAAQVSDESMKSAAKVVFEKKRDNGESTVAGTSVTFDGTWMRRGFSSQHGVFTCIDWDSGLILDKITLSKYCHACVTWKTRLEKKEVTQVVYDEWKGEHACSANTTSSSPAMEGEAAVTLWSRSVDKNKLQYIQYIGDGDSKGFSNVTAAQPYGPTVEITKEECVGHVQKRMGTRLRQLKKDMKGQKLEDGKPLIGRGRMTDAVINTLQNYYGMAVKENTNNLQYMAKAIWASIMHRISTDDNPQHQFCPTGANSWCGWQKDQALGVQTYVHHDAIPMAVFKVVKPIYVSLSDKALLQRCLRGATQNQNEAFNGMVWHYCPKDGFASSEVVDMAANLAVVRFNNGALILLAVLRKVGCNPAGNFTIRQLELEDKKRVEDAQSFASESKKRRRKTLRKRRKGFADQAAEQEGITYEAGAF